MEMEYTHSHRREMRRLQKAEFLKTHFGKLKEKEEREQQQLVSLCQGMKQQTIELRQGMFRNMQESGKLRMEIARLGQTQKTLKKQCKGFATAVELFREAIAAAGNGEQP